MPGSSAEPWMRPWWMGCRLENGGTGVRKFHILDPEVEINGLLI